MEKITSKQNDRVKFLCKLRDRNKRDRYGMFLIEGFRELSRAVENKPSIIDSIWFCEEIFHSCGQHDFIKKMTISGIPLCQTSRDVFEKISNREHCDGLIGLAKFWNTKIEGFKREVLRENPLILVAEEIEKSGNLGALMRSAESAGIDIMILCNPVTDIFNPNVIRASQGAIFALPIATADNEHALQFLTKNSINIFVATPSANNFYFHEDFTNGSAIVVGSEHSGVSDFWMQNSVSKKISLPQLGICDSLNVNDAAVVVLYDVLRQRMPHKCQ